MNVQFFILQGAIHTWDLTRFKQEWNPKVANMCFVQTGKGLLYEAIYWGNRIEFVEFMLKNGADPNILSFKPKGAPFVFDRVRDGTERIAVCRLLVRHGGNPYLKNMAGLFWFNDTYIMESYLVAELVCGEADNIPLDLWRVIKHFIL